MASDPPALCATASRVVVCSRDAAKPDNTPVVVDERGRVDDDAILGRFTLPLRVTPFGDPGVRFLSTSIHQTLRNCMHTTNDSNHSPLLNHIRFQ